MKKNRAYNKSADPSERGVFLTLHRYNGFPPGPNKTRDRSHPTPAPTLALSPARDAMPYLPLRVSPPNRCPASFRAASMGRFAATVIACGLILLGSAAAARAETSPQWPFPRGTAESTGATEQTLPQTLSLLWEYEGEEAIEATPVVANGRVFFGDVMGRLYCVGLEQGQEIWQHNYDTGFLASPAVRDDLLVIGDVYGNLYGADAATGKQRWKKTTEGEINGAPAFFKDKVLITSQDGKLYCFDADDGELAWTYQTDDQIRCSPALAGDRTFLGGCDGQLHMVDLNTGKAIGEPLPLGGPTGSTPAIVGTKAVLPTMDGLVLAFDWKDQTELWRYEDPQRPQEYRSSAAVRGDVVVVSSRNKYVDALSLESGERIWRHTLRRRADASPVIAGEDVWIAATDGRLVRLSLKDGEPKWEYEIRGSFLAAPAIAGDRLIVADDKGVVRCFGPETP